jgi:hypothetical protein
MELLMKLLVLSENIRLVWNWATLAYYDLATIMGVKRFTVPALAA